MNSVTFYFPTIFSHPPYAKGPVFGPVTFVMYDCTLRYILAS